MSILVRFLDPLIKRGRLTVIFADGKSHSFGQPHPDLNDVTIRFRTDQVVRKIATSPTLGFTEAYMAGHIDILDGDIWDFTHLYAANSAWEDRRDKRKRKSRRQRIAKKYLKKTVRRLEQLNDAVRSKENVAHHYDLGNDLYRLFLDEDMQYSCAYFSDPDMSLDEAQRAKKAHIAAKLALEPGQRVLDIGCGWGGMALYLNRVANVEVLGITLSQEQLSLATERARLAGVADKVRFELIDYRDLAKREPAGFDRIVSVGMFEHVGQPQFETYFDGLARLMKHEGVALIHTIGRFGGPGRTDPFTRKYIFPGGYIPALSETVAASEKAGLMASDVETLRLHYGKTLRHWYERTLAERDRIIALYDERFYRMWTTYLGGAGAAFHWGGMGNYQIQYVRDRHALPITRDYMLTKEAEYLAKG